MDTFSALAEHLYAALNHLYDPCYQPPELLCSVMGCNAQRGAGPVQAAIIRAIRDLEPSPDIPSDARSRRIYELLSSRFVQGLTQEEAAERLGITPRHLRREQRQAIEVLARRLWQRSRGEVPPESRTADEEPVQTHRPDTREAEEWRSQVRRELTSLQRSAPGSVADVPGTVAGVVALAQALASRHGVALTLGTLGSSLVAAIHPSGLRQILLGCIAELIRHMAGGEIELAAGRQGDQVRITVTGRPVAGEPPGELAMKELLAMQGGSIRWHRLDGSLSFVVDLPAAGKVTVLVVDDNPDLIHFYERFVLGTRYQIVAVHEGEAVLGMVQSLAPDIIVLDVMLPGIDGWELLVNLHEHPASRSIPVVVCSVVREEELSLALGATLYVPKPVGRRQFLQALDQALSQAAGGAPGAPASSATPD